MASRSRPSLRHGVDRDIYQIIRKIEVDTEGSTRRLTVSSVYETIKNSNSSLARQKKRPLEDSIERVLAYRKEEIKADEAGEDSDELIEREAAAAAAAAAAKSAAAKRERDAFLLNKQMTKHWDFGATSSAASAVSSPGKQPAADATSSSQPPSATAATADSGAGVDVNGGGDAMSIDRQPNGEPKLKRKRRTRNRDDDAPPLIAREPNSGLKLEDLGGIEHILDALHELVYIPLCFGNLFAEVGSTPQNCILLHGPSGTGKTTLMHAVADKVKAAFIPVSPTSLVSGISGESEKNIRDFVDEAIRLAPSLVFIDEIDVVAGKVDGAQKAMEVRMLSEISQGLDKIARVTAGSDRQVVVVAATNRPESIEPTIRRRFQELEVSMPDEAARKDILQKILRPIATASDIDFTALARLTPGYVGADLRKAVELAALRSVCDKAHRTIEERTKARAAAGLDADKIADRWEPPQADVIAAAAAADLTPDQTAMVLDEGSGANLNSGGIQVTFEHLKKAVAAVQPAAKREGFSTVPNTTWAEVGALQNVRRKLELAIVGPIEEPERFALLGIKPAAGILLWGPPGCGKTLVAKAVANASKANFISIKGPELLNKYVGESEANVRQLFSRAKSSAPCILFFDELDALAPRRDFGGNAATSRVVNALLTELDGVNDRSGIYVVGATNRPDEIDEAVRRPGRLGTNIYVGLPTADDRIDILRTIYRTTVPVPTVPDATIEKVARDPRCERFSGADLRQLLQVTSENCIMRYGLGSKETPTIQDEDWEAALQQVKPSVKSIEKYLKLLQMA